MNSYFRLKIQNFAKFLNVVLFAILLVGLSCKQVDFITGGLAEGKPYIAVEAPDDPRISHLSWPKLVKTNNGIFVLAYSAGVGHNRGGSGPAVSISEDGGQTFSSPQVLGYYPDDDERYRDSGNTALGIAEDGAVILLAMAYRGNENNTIVGWRSEDDGRTWIKVNTDNIAENKTGSVFGEILNVPGKGLVVFGHYRQPSNPPHGIFMSVSVDGGKTWGVPQTVVSTMQHRYAEPSVTFTQGRFVGLFRDARAPEHRRYDLAVSDDLGETWKITPSEIIIPRHLGGMQPSPFITHSPNNPSQLYAIQSIRGKEENTSGKMYLWTADVNNLKWTNTGLIVGIHEDAVHLADWSYPWMQLLSEDKWLVVFYAGERLGSNSIYGLVIKTENIK